MTTFNLSDFATYFATEALLEILVIRNSDATFEKKLPKKISLGNSLVSSFSVFFLHKFSRIREIFTLARESVSLVLKSDLT